MTPRLPAISAAKLLRILRSHGFEVARQSGSHGIPMGGAPRFRCINPEISAAAYCDGS